MMNTAEKAECKKKKGAKILVVEDEARLLYSLSFVLKRQGFRVTPVTDAESALKKLTIEKNDFNLIISDMHLPGMSGLEFIDKLHSMNDFSPLLVITAYRGKSVFDALEKRGIKTILQKPFDITELMDRIAEALNHKTVSIKSVHQLHNSLKKGRKYVQ